MKIVYRIRDDEAIHRNNRGEEHPEMGFTHTHGRFLSNEWWRSFDSDAIPFKTYSGTIIRVEDSPKGAGPEFELQTPSGVKETFYAFFNHRPDLQEYQPRRKAQVDCIFMEPKKDPLGRSKIRVVVALPQ